MPTIEEYFNAIAAEYATAASNQVNIPASVPNQYYGPPAPAPLAPSLDDFMGMGTSQYYEYGGAQYPDYAPEQEAIYGAALNNALTGIAATTPEALAGGYSPEQRYAIEQGQANAYEGVAATRSSPDLREMALYPEAFGRTYEQPDIFGDFYRDITRPANQAIKYVREPLLDVAELGGRVLGTALTAGQEPLRQGLQELGVNLPGGGEVGARGARTAADIALPRNIEELLLELVPGMGTVPGVVSAAREALSNPALLRRLVQATGRNADEVVAGLRRLATEEAGFARVPGGGLSDEAYDALKRTPGAAESVMRTTPDVVPEGRVPGAAERALGGTPDMSPGLQSLHDSPVRSRGFALAREAEINAYLQRLDQLAAMRGRNDVSELIDQARDLVDQGIWGDATRLSEEALALLHQAERAEIGAFQSDLFRVADELETAAPTGRLPGAAERALGGTPPPREPPAPPTGGGQPLEPPVAKLTDAISQARPLPGQTEALRSQVRRQRVAIGAKTLEEGGRTPEAYGRARGALAGEMPRTGFEPLAQQFSPEEIQQYRDMLSQAELRFYEEINAEEALTKVLDGRLNEIRDFELVLLDRVFGSEMSYAIANKVAPPIFRDKIFEYWLANILSGPLTQIRNIVGNLSTAIAAPIERLGSAALDVPVSRITGRQRERFFAEAPAIVQGLAMGLPDGVRGALKVFREGFNPAQIGRIEQRQRAIGGVAGRVIRLPFTGLEAADTFFKAINSEAAYRALAVREAKKEGLRGQAYLDRLAELLAERPDDLLEQAFKQSEAWLFRDDPTRVGKAVLAARKEFPVLGFVIPFARTPDRLIAYGIRRSPLGLFDAPMWKRLMRGNPEAVDELTHTLMGTAIATGVATSVATGVVDITAGVPITAAERDRFFREGKQPFSINIPHVGWVQYNQIPALAETLTMVAAATEAYREGWNIEDIAARIGGTIGQSIADRSYMSGLADLMDAVMDPGRYAERFATRWVTGFVPFSSALRQTANINDPTIRSPENLKEAFQANIPGLTGNVPPRLTAFGEEATRSTPFSPIVVSPDRQTAVDAELGRYP